VLSLSVPASVTVTICNMAGRPVRVLCRSRQLEAGPSRLAWNGLSDAGVAVPGGMYLIEATADAGDGSQCRALAQVTVE